MFAEDIDRVLLEPLLQCRDLFDNETFATLSREPIRPTQLSPTKICVFLLVFIYYSMLPSKRSLENSTFLAIMHDILFKGKGGHSFAELCNFLRRTLSNENGAHFVTSLTKTVEPLTKDFSTFYVKLRCMCDRLIDYCQVPADDQIVKDFANFFWYMADLPMLTVLYEYFKAYVLPNGEPTSPEKIDGYVSDSESDDCTCSNGFDSSSSFSVELSVHRARTMPKIPTTMFVRDAEVFARQQIAHIRLGTGQAYPHKMLDDWLLVMRNRYSRLYSLRYLHFLNSMRVMNGHLAEIDILDSCSKIYCPEFGEDERTKGPKSRRKKFAPSAAIVQKFIFRAELMSQCGRRIFRFHAHRDVAVKPKSPLYRTVDRSSISLSTDNGTREMAKRLYAECLRASSVRHNNRMAASCLFPLVLLEEGSKQVACFKSLLLTMKVIPNPGMPTLRFYIKHWLATLEVEHMLPPSRLVQLTELAEEAASLMKADDIFNDAPYLATVANAAMSSYALLFGDYKKANELWANTQSQRSSSEELFEGESTCLLGSNSALASFLQGNVEAARKTLQTVKSSFREHGLSRHWRKCEASMNFSSSYFKQDVVSCRDSIATLATFSPLDAKLKECALLLSSGEIGECQRLLVDIRNDCEEKRIHLFRWLLLAAEAAAYQNGDTQRMSYYLRTLKRISVHQKDTNAAALAGLLEAIIHLLRGDAEQLLRMAADTLPKLAKTGTAFEQGQCRFLLGIGHLMKARQAIETAEKEKILNRSVEDMTEAASQFALVEAPYHEKVALWYLAQVYHGLGRWNLRNQKADAFLLLDEAYPGDCHMQFLAKALLLPKD